MGKSHFSIRARPAGAFVRTIGLAAGLAALSTFLIDTAHSQTVANPMRPIPIPAQVSAKDGVAQLPDSRLWYWDTGGQGVPVVYEGIGKDTFPASLDCLSPRGMFVSFGNASGPVAARSTS